MFNNVIVQYLLLFIGVTQAIVELIKVYEIPGYGQEKKKMVLDTIETIYNHLCDVIDIKISLDKVIKFSSSMIDLVVNFYNFVGIFKKS